MEIQKSRPFWFCRHSAACAGRCQEGWVLWADGLSSQSLACRGRGGGAFSISGETAPPRVREGWAPGACMHRVGLPSRSRCSPRASVWLFCRSPGCPERPGLTPDFPACLFIPGSVLRQQLKHSACLPPSTSPVFGHV